MHDVLQIFILLPMFGLLLAVLVPPKKERILSGHVHDVFPYEPGKRFAAQRPAAAAA